MSTTAGRTAEVSAGPVLSFGFNLAKVPDHGEDSDPILREGPDLGLLGVFDGMGGAGGTVYDTADGQRSGAYLASRIARDTVEERMIALLEPNWTLKGAAAAEDLRRSMQQALQETLRGLDAPQSRLRSRLLRALPTTMALIALQRAAAGGARWIGHVFWAGDSRAYVLETGGLRQLSTDDLRDSNDAMENLRRDSVVSNAVSADTEFQVRYRRVELTAPFAVLCATDGCFGYLPTPMHFERLLLRQLAAARTVDGWSRGVQSGIAAVAGDDASMALIGVGADLPALKQVLEPRLRSLDEAVEPADALAEAVIRAERDLESLRKRQQSDLAARWNAYKTDYERYLHVPEPVEEDEPQERVPAGVDASLDPGSDIGAADLPASADGDPAASGTADGTDAAPRDDPSTADMGEGEES